MGAKLPADAASTWSEDSHDSSRTPSSPYPAALKPFRPLALSGGAKAQATATHLAADMLLEQFERAQQYVASRREDFPAERLETLQVTATATAILVSYTLHSQRILVPFMQNSHL